MTPAQSRVTSHESRAAWLQRCLAWRDAYDPVRPEFFKQDAPHPYAFAALLSQAADEDAVVVTDCGGNVVVMNQAFRTKAGQRFFSNNGNSPMGFSMCGALGAWFAAPDRQVICVIGDGGFNMNLQELQTILNYGAKVKTFVLDNRVYGITKAFQRTNMGGRYEACGPVGYKPPNFTHLVAAYGLHGVLCRSNDMLESCIRITLRHDGPSVCIVDCAEFSTYEPRIAQWDAPIEEMSPRLPEDEFLRNMTIEPWEGFHDRQAREAGPKP